MAEEFHENNEENTPDPQDYEVGYKKPPKHTQFKKGKSGNPTGRPEGSKNKPKGAEALIRELILKEGLSEVELVINGQKERLSVVQGILKQNNVKALKGNTAATRLSLQLLKEAEKEENEQQCKQEADKLALAERAQRLKSFWTEEIKYCREHGLPIELPIPHPDHIQIDPQTLEVTIKCMTKESVNATIDQIGRLAKLEALSIGLGLLPAELWTEGMMRRLPCEHVRDQMDFSVPATPDNMFEYEAGAHIFKIMCDREIPECAHEDCQIRNFIAEDILLDYAGYSMSRISIPTCDPLWREYGPVLTDQYLDQAFFYGAEPDIDAYKVADASVPDKREQELIGSIIRSEEEEAFRTFMRAALEESMGDQWKHRFDPINLVRRDPWVDYLAYHYQSDDSDKPLDQAYVDAIKWPSFLGRYSHESDQYLCEILGLEFRKFEHGDDNETDGS